MESGEKPLQKEVPFSSHAFAREQVSRLFASPILHPEINKYRAMSVEEVEKILHMDGFDQKEDRGKDLTDPDQKRGLTQYDLEYFYDAIRMLQISFIRNEAVAQVAALAEINSHKASPSHKVQGELTHAEKHKINARNKNTARHRREWINNIILEYGLPQYLGSKNVVNYLQSLQLVCQTEQKKIADKFFIPDIYYEVDPNNIRINVLEPTEDVTQRIKATEIKVIKILFNSSLDDYPFFDIVLPHEFTQLFSNSTGSVSVKELLNLYLESNERVESNPDLYIHYTFVGVSDGKNQVTSPVDTTTEKKVASKPPDKDDGLKDESERNAVSPPYTTQLEAELMGDLYGRASTDEVWERQKVQDGMNLYYFGQKYGDPEKKATGMKIWQNLGLEQEEIDRMIRDVDVKIASRYDPKPARPKAVPPDPILMQRAERVYLAGLINHDPARLEEAQDIWRGQGLSEWQIRQRIKEAEKLRNTPPDSLEVGNKTPPQTNEVGVPSPDPVKLDTALTTYFFGLINHKPVVMEEALEQLRDLGLRHDEITKYIRYLQKVSLTPAVKSKPSPHLQSSDKK